MDGTPRRTFLACFIPVQADDYTSRSRSQTAPTTPTGGAHPRAANTFVVDNSDPPSDVDVASGFGQGAVPKDFGGAQCRRRRPRRRDPGSLCGLRPILQSDRWLATAPAPAPTRTPRFRAAGPRIALAGKAKASRKGVVPIVLTNPYAFRLKGKLSLKDGKRKAGSKSFSLGSNAKQAVMVKLPRKVFKRLKRKRRLRLAALATGRAAVGKSRTRRGKVG